MFTGFNLKTQEEFQKYYSIGNNMYNDMKNDVEKSLDTYIGQNGSLNGSKMQEDWFPQIKADIFISHSHNDEKIAIGLAGWLKEKHDVVAFIDSCIWGYSNDLLKTIDDKYCCSKEYGFYNYESRNFSTSHVHMMLSTALTMMIDKTECVFFLNTPNSTCSTADTIKNETNSPWIYSEIATSRLIQKKDLLPKERMKKRQEILLEIKKNFAEKRDQLQVSYDVDFKHLHTLNDNDLEMWKDETVRHNSKKQDAMDNLYKIKNINSKENPNI